MLSLDHGPEIAAVFGLGAEPRLSGPVARGQLGQVWRLDTGCGSFAVKDPFEEVRPDDAEADAAYQDVVRAAGVPVPAVVRSRDGRVLEMIGDAPVRVYEWVDVIPKDRDLDPAEVGSVVARIHQAVLPASGPVHEWYTTSVGADRWQELVRRLRAEAAPYVDELAALLPSMLELEELVESAEAEQWCHLDLWSDNVRRSPAGGLVVLDWENAMPGVPAHELPLLVYEFGLGDPGRIERLLRAYAEAGGPARITSAATFSGVVAQVLHIVEIACRSWLEEPEERTRHEAWVREFLDDPLTPATVDLAVAVAQRTA